jgi:transposase
MLSLPPSVRIFVATQPIDGRKGVDSLAAMVRSVFIQDPLSGHLYVFFSRRCDRVRIIYWDRNGFAMWTKRLERGRFQAPVDGSALSLKVLEAAELGMILDGLELAGARRRPRWEPGARARGEFSASSREFEQHVDPPRDKQAACQSKGQ